MANAFPLAAGMVTPDRKPKMKWTRECDETLCVQVLAERPYQYKKYSPQLTDTWDAIAGALAAVDGFENSNVKGIRERFGKIMEGRRKQMNNEKAMSWVAIEENDRTRVTDNLLENIDG